MRLCRNIHFGLVGVAALSCGPVQGAPVRHLVMSVDAAPSAAFTGPSAAHSLLPSLFEHVLARRGTPDTGVIPFIDPPFISDNPYSGDVGGGSTTASINMPLPFPGGSPSNEYTPPSSGGRGYDPMVPMGPDGLGAGPDDGVGGASGNDDEVAIPVPVPLPTPFLLGLLGGIATLGGLSARRPHRVRCI